MSGRGEPSRGEQAPGAGGGARAGGVRPPDERARERVVELTAPRVSCPPRALVLGPEVVIPGKAGRSGPGRGPSAVEQGARRGVAGVDAVGEGGHGARRGGASPRVDARTMRTGRGAAPAVGWPLGLSSAAQDRRWKGPVTAGLVAAVVSAAAVVLAVWSGQGRLQAGRAVWSEMGASVGGGFGAELDGSVGAGGTGGTGGAARGAVDDADHAVVAGGAEAEGAGGAQGLPTGPERSGGGAGSLTGSQGSGGAFEASEGPTGGVEGVLVEPGAAPHAALALKARGLPATALLGRRVERVLEGGELGYVRLGELVRGGRVTVLHVWATWCAACVREMPALRGLFSAAGWGREVSFVAAQADEAPPLWAYSRFVGAMPAGAVYVVDPELMEGLRQTGLLEGEGALPVTMLFDCRRTLRAASSGALDEQGVAALGAAVAALEAELGQAACRPQPSVAAPVRCGEELCPAGDLCARVGAQERCVRRPGGLKGE